MKKVINRKMYNTDTAERICFRRDSYEDNYTTLYRKKNGEFFFLREELNGRSRIRLPYWETEAMDFAEENLDGDTYEKFFGPVEE